MTGQELATATGYGAGSGAGKLISIVVDNGTYGTIRMHQEREYPGRVSGSDLFNPDFVALARAYGWRAERVDATAGFEPAFRAALAAPRPTLMHLKLGAEVITTRTTISAIRAAARRSNEGLTLRPAQGRTISSRRSMPPSTIEIIARSRTAGFAWYATDRPTASIIGRSLAPSPTAIALRRCRCARRSQACSSGAPLLVAVADVAPGLVDHPAGEPAVGDLEHVGTRLVDLQPVAHAVAEEREAAGDEQGVQPGGAAGRDDALDARVEAQPLVVDACSAAAGAPFSSATRRRRLSL